MKTTDIICQGKTTTSANKTVNIGLMASAMPWLDCKTLFCYRLTPDTEEILVVPNLNSTDKPRDWKPPDCIWTLRYRGVHRLPWKSKSCNVWCSLSAGRNNHQIVLNAIAKTPDWSEHYKQANRLKWTQLPSHQTEINTIDQPPGQRLNQTLHPRH